MRGHGHDGAGAVAGEDVIGNPDGNFLSINRIDGVSAGEHAGFLLGQFSPFEIGLLGDFGFVFCYRFALFGRCDLVNQLVFR